MTFIIEYDINIDRMEVVMIENQSSLLAIILAIIWLPIICWKIIRFINPIIEVKDNWIKPNKKKRRGK